MKNLGWLCAGVLACGVVLSGQNAAPPDGTMQALVGEIHELRGDINRVFGASIRTQLLVGRLQLQEQRVLTLSRQIADVQKEIANIAQSRVAMEEQVAQWEEAKNVRVEERDDLERAAKQMRAQLAQHRKREQELRQQEAGLSAVAAEEQSRWTDFSSRLDDLERALSSPPRQD